jgi:phosphoribosylanthranilate isomerase
MALKTKVKVGRITNLSDARYCAGMGVDMLGFSTSGPNSISFDKFKEINGWITGPKLVLEVHKTEDVEIALSTYLANFLEVNIDLLDSLKPRDGVSLIVRIDIGRWDKNLLSTSGRQDIEHILIENYTRTNEETLKQISKTYPILLELNDSTFKLDEVLELPIDGIALMGSDELRPGLKDYNQLSQVLEKLDVD